MWMLMWMLGMLQLGFVASNNIETDFIELTINEPDRPGTSQNGRKQDIQAGHLAENKTFGTDFPRLEQKQPKQNSGIISNKADPQKVKSSKSVWFNSERNGSFVPIRTAETQKAQKNRRKRRKGIWSD